MNLEELLSADPNTLPYRLRRVATGESGEVRFEPTTADDAEELRAEDWAKAKFAEVWPEFAELAGTLKVVLAQGEDRRIQGILKVGRVPFRGFPLGDSLLESAPWNQHGAEDREYRGIGRALVLRLVVESLRQGGGGSILVTAAPRSERFYEALGFVPGRQEAPDRFRLTQRRAMDLLREAWGIGDEPEG